MPTLHRLKRKRRRVCVGDLDTRVQIETRSQVPPPIGVVDAEFLFSPISGDGYVWARVETLSGRTVFDGVSQDRRVSHSVVIRTLAGADAEVWVKLADGTRLDVVQAEAYDERGEFTELLCDARGPDHLALSGL